MLTRISTAMLTGVAGQPVIVETDLQRGMPTFNLVGLADTTIKEACQRIRPAILNSGYCFPNERVTINLVPTGRPKEGSHFDLPIALGIITLETENAEVSNIAFMGELSLDGKVNYVRGALPLAMSMRKAGIKNIVLPQSNADEVSILEDMNILPIKMLSEAVNHITGRKKINIYNGKKKIVKKCEQNDFSQVIGQESAKRALTIGAAGNHGVLIVGGPGCGKTMMAKRIPTILPELTYEEKLEITGIYSVAGLLSEESPIVEQRPFRSPHSTISKIGLVGGGSKPKPGEITLAHRGVLFLDELGEFDSKVIDAMRQPVEDGYVRINRNLEEVLFPSKVMIVAAANPCKCGNLWDDKKICTCSAKQLDSHRRKLTGPFSDRIDMHIRVSPVSKESIVAVQSKRTAVSSEDMRGQVKMARSIQRERYKGTEIADNGSLDEKGMQKFCMLDRESSEVLNMAYEKLGLTMRAYWKLVKISRTLADLGGEENIKVNHITEALIYRLTDWNNEGNEYD